MINSTDEIEVTPARRTGEMRIRRYASGKSVSEILASAEEGKTRHVSHRQMKALLDSPAAKARYRHYAETGVYAIELRLKGRRFVLTSTTELTGLLARKAKAVVMH